LKPAIDTMTDLWYNVIGTSNTTHNLGDLK